MREEMKNNIMSNINNFTACEKCKGVCWNCLYADACDQWNDTGLSVPVINNSGDIVGYTGGEK